MKKIILLSFIILIKLPVFSQYGQEIDVSDAMKSALDIRTSGVRIAKDYLYRGLKSKFVARENDNNLSTGEKAILTLEIYANEFPDIKPQLKKLKTKWKKMRVLALQKPERKKMDGLLAKLKDFIEASNNVIEEIKKTNHIKVIDYQQASNEMELLAQQLTLLYAMQVANIKDPSLDMEMNNCKINFQKNLDKTFYSGENTLDIAEALKRIQADWELSKQSIQSKKESLLNTLYIMMNKISDQSRKAAELYQQKAKEALKKEK